VALRRAAHQLLDHPRVFEDPLAVAIAGAEASREQAAEGEPGYSRALRAFLAARSRYAEDQIAHAFERGARQYVALGAGLDTFAYRNPYAGLRVFEVDHPATQEWKRAQLGAAGIVIPESMTFAAVDFERQSLGEGLIGAGFDRGVPAFFSWLGVTPYLSREAFDATIAFVAALSSGTGVVFDYAVERSLLSPARQRALDALSERVARAGEPFQLFFDPRGLVGDMARAGFGEIEDLDAEAINARYFANRADGLAVSSGGRLLCAWIK
jgi:methyltransferase (TIGR00027 family)